MDFKSTIIECEYMSFFLDGIDFKTLLRYNSVSSSSDVYFYMKTVLTDVSAVCACMCVSVCM